MFLCLKPAKQILCQSLRENKNTSLCSYVFFLKNCVQRTAWHYSLLTPSHIIYIILKSIFIQYTFHNSIIMSNFARILEWYSSLILMNLRPKGETE